MKRKKKNPAQVSNSNTLIRGRTQRPKSKILPLELSKEESEENKNEREKSKYPKSLFANRNRIMTELTSDNLPGTPTGTPRTPLQAFELEFPRSGSTERVFSAQLKDPTDHEIASLVNPKRIDSKGLNFYYVTDKQGHTRRVNKNKDTPYVVMKTDSNTQTNITMEFKKKEEIRTKGCCMATMITVAVYNIYIYICMYIYIYIYIHTYIYI